MSNILLEFADYRRSRGREITPELIQVGLEIEECKEVRTRYENRPLRCRLGIHSRRQSWSGDGYLGSCVICWREKL